MTLQWHVLPNFVSYCLPSRHTWMSKRISKIKTTSQWKQRVPSQPSQRAESLKDSSALTPISNHQVTKMLSLLFISGTTALVSAAIYLWLRYCNLQESLTSLSIECKVEPTQPSYQLHFCLALPYLTLWKLMHRTITIGPGGQKVNHTT